MDERANITLWMVAVRRAYADATTLARKTLLREMYAELARRLIAIQ